MERKHIALLPSSVPLSASTSSTRFLRLPHPRTFQPALFAPYTRPDGEEGLLEVQKLQLETGKERCWFLEEEIVADGSVTLLTPFDPLFLVVSYLFLLPSRFQSYDDTWDAIGQHKFESPCGGEKGEKGEVEEQTFAEDLTRLGMMKCVRERMEKVCEAQEHDSTSLFRISSALVLDVLKSKIDNLVSTATGVFGQLESTSPGVEKVAKVEEGGEVAAERKFETVRRGLGKEGAGTGQGLSEEIQLESRQKYAVGILANYLPPTLSHTLLSSYSFTALTAYLSSSLNSSILGTSYLPGRGSSSSAADLSSELGGGSAAAAKKRKAEASKGSRGVEALKKVNTKGMKSLKDMFAKQPASKEKKAVTEKKPVYKKK